MMRSTLVVNQWGRKKVSKERIGSKIAVDPRHARQPATCPKECPMQEGHESPSLKANTPYDMFSVDQHALGPILHKEKWIWPILSRFGS